MDCEDEYNTLTKSTEKLHELYYQQENANFAFSNALSSAQNYLITMGLVRLVTTSPAEIVNTLEDRNQEGFTELHDAAISKVQADSAVAAAEESYSDATKRYEECIKKHVGNK